MADGLHDYLSTNLRLAEILNGCRLASVVRLLDEQPDEDARFEWGPALLVGESGRQWLIDADESKANILFLPGLGLDSDWYRTLTVRVSIAEDVTGHPLRFLVTEPINKVEVISREPDEGVPDSYAMCGLRLTTVSGSRVCVGTHLTEPPYPAVAFLLDSEVSEALRYTPLGA